MDGTGEAQLDHFQPKVEFPQLAFAWPNLYLACAACNRAKLDGWSALLVRPDEPGFRFSDFFLVNPSSGELEARPGPNEARARETIRVMHLNRPGLCTLRSDAIKRPNTTVAPESRPYRFLLQARDALG
ncbi:MAG: hypothetical protein MUC96_25530 [Myxococcaceae bacterium]|nr:hypothetical protein [Myxococcaceae bacterium]